MFDIFLCPETETHTMDVGRPIDDCSYDIFLISCILPAIEAIREVEARME